MQSPGITLNSNNILLTALCNCMKEGAAIIEEDSRAVIFCNKAWLNMFEVDSLAELDMTKLNHLRKTRLTNEEVLSRLNMAKEEGVFREQVEYISIKGKAFWGELTITPYIHEADNFYLVTVERIDKEKETERNIAQSKQRFEAILEHASMGIIETNKDAEIININSFGSELFGYGKEELLGQKVELLIPLRLHSRHIQHTKDYVDQPKSRPMGVGMDLYAVKKDGTEFPVEVSLSTYKRNGDLCVIAFVSDISIRKQTELEIQKLNDELEQIVDQRTKELQTAVLQLELSKEELSKLLEKEKELGELKSRFVSMASHEFRTPLSTVLSSVYLLEKYNKGEEQPKREKHLNRIVSSVNMLTDILNDFLSVGKIEEGKIHVKYSVFDIQLFITSIIEELRNNLKNEQTIVYNHEGDPTVTLDASLLKHIVMNLVSNASKFSAEKCNIEIRSSCTPLKTIVAVADQGIGISKDDQKHLMERFFRATNATNIQGTGLGLHIVSKYAELMNGVVECRSELQKGTEFIITFNTKKEV